MIGVLSLLLISMISAEIILSQPRALYSLGDDLEVEIKLDSFQEGYLDVSLICGEYNENIYHDIPKEKIINIERGLLPLYIGNLSGTCHIKAEYGLFAQSSQIFEISKNIEVIPEITQVNIKAGESVIIKGQAIKENDELVGQILNGFIEVSLGEEVKSTDNVEDGQFKINFSTSDTMRSGTYPISIKVYEKDSQGNILSIGETKADLIINQELDKIDIALENQIAIPGENISIAITLYDKAGDIMQGDVSLKIENSLNEIVYEKLVKTNTLELYLKNDHAPGYSKIIVEKDDVIKEKIIDVQENEKISINPKNNTLVITNIGNVHYKKIIDVQIGERTLLIEVDLEKGKSKDYDLSAPDGEYNVKITDSSGDIFNDYLSLTGNSIGVRENKSVISRLTILWLMIIVIMGVGLMTLYNKNLKKKSYSFPIRFGKKKSDGKPVEKKVITVEKSGKKLERKRSEHVLVLNGQKQEASILALEVKNEIEKNAKLNLAKIIEESGEGKAVLNQSGKYFLLIFTPLITKTFKNNILAIKAGQKIEEILKENNRKLKDKVEYGIGVNKGEIINKLENNVLKFTSVGNTVSLAKKIANKSRDEVLLSKAVHEKTMTEVKAEKAGKIGEEDVFKITRMIHSEGNKEFVRNFLDKNKKN